MDTVQYEAVAAPGLELTIAISTMAARSSEISLPEPALGIRYVIIVQGGEPAFSFPDDRDDLRVVLTETRGLARSRNIALRETATPLMLIADDDLTFSMEGIQEAVDWMNRNPDVAILTGRLVDETGAFLKTYPDEARDWKIYNCGRIGSPEIMLRPDVVIKAGLLFEEEFGAGSTYPSGEEFILITDAMKSGLTVHFEPITIASHPRISTGSNWSDPQLLAARAAVLNRVFGKFAPCVRSAYAFRKVKIMGLRNALAFAAGRLTLTNSQ